MIATGAFTRARALVPFVLAVLWSGAGCERMPPVSIVTPFDEEIVVTASVPVEVAFGPGVNGSGFRAELNGQDVTASFAVSATGATASFPVGGTVTTGRNRLQIVVGSGLGASGSVSDFSVALGQAVATRIPARGADLLIEGPNARGRVGDYILYNDLVQVIVEDVTPLDGGKAVRDAYGAHVYGGNIIDADLKRAPGDPERDSFEVLTPLINVESTTHPRTATIVNDGSNGQPAVLRFEGPDDILDTQNLSSLVVLLGGGLLSLPERYDDRDLPLEIETLYSLAPGDNFVTVTTTLKNTGGQDLRIPVGDWVNGAGEGEVFFPGLGYGGASGTGTLLRLEADYGALVANGPTMAGVSYGYVPSSQGGNNAVSSGGLNIFLDDASLLAALFGADVGLAVPSGGTASYTRRFVVGNGDATPVSVVRDRALGRAHGRLEGFVTAGGLPVAGARVSLVAASAPAFQSADVVGAFETDAGGHYSGSAPPGTYFLLVNATGHLAPEPTMISVSQDGITQQSFELPAPGRLVVNVADRSGAPGPGKVSVVGIDPSPSLPVELDLLGFLQSTGGIFRNDGDTLPAGLVAVELAGPDGRVDFPVEPGTYQVTVSRGPEHDVDQRIVSVASGQTRTVDAVVRRVLDTPGFVASDFHQHQQASYDSPTSNATRVRTNLAEGLDFFVSTDHDFVADLAPAIAELGAGDLVGHAPAAEVTPSDYGHVNPWPLTPSASRNGGSLDWSRGEVPGQDFPSFGAYGMTPGELYAALRALDPDAGAEVVQLNHLNAIQMGTFEALGIDTGTVPPSSNFDPADFRLDPSAGNLFSDDFDAMELWIGAGNDDIDELMEQNLGDWFNLLNQGIVTTATCNSDTHVARRVQAGSPRNYVASSTDAPAAIDPDEIAENVIAGRSICSNGPFLWVSARATSTGQSASLADGAPRLLSTTDGRVELVIAVGSAPWVDFDRIEIYRGTRPVPVDHDGEAATPPRYGVTPSRVLHAGDDFAVHVVPANGSSRREAMISLPLVGFGDRDSWIVVLVRGSEGVSRPLFPVVPNDADGSQSAAELFDNTPHDAGVRALAFANPLFVDADGNGMYDPPQGP